MASYHERLPATVLDSRRREKNKKVRPALELSWASSRSPVAWPDNSRTGFVRLRRRHALGRAGVVAVPEV